MKPFYKYIKCTLVSVLSCLKSKASKANSSYVLTGNNDNITFNFNKANCAHDLHKMKHVWKTYRLTVNFKPHIHINPPSDHQQQTSVSINFSNHISTM